MVFTALIQAVSVSAEQDTTECRASDFLYDGRPAYKLSSLIPASCIATSSEKLDVDNSLILDQRIALSKDRIHLDSIPESRIGSLTAILKNIPDERHVFVIGDIPYGADYAAICDKESNFQVIQYGLRDLIRNGVKYRQRDSAPESDPFDIRSTKLMERGAGSLVVVTQQAGILWNDVVMSKDDFSSLQFDPDKIYIYQRDEFSEIAEDSIFMKLHPNVYYVNDVKAYLVLVKKHASPSISGLSKRRCG